jgi:hypothetical protein
MSAVLAPELDSVPSTRRAPRRRAPGLSTLFTGVFALFGFGVGIGRLSDNSFFWHLKTGGLILDHGIPHHDVFSFSSEGTKWVAQSWLAEVAYAGLDRTVGAFGIRLLGALTGLLIGVLTYRLALRLAGERMRAALVAVVSLIGIYTLWSERPLLLGVLCLLVLLWTVEVPDCRLGRHPLVALPILFWLWANVHGTFALGFAYLGLHLVGRWLDGARPWTGRERTLLAGGALAFVATFVNPYGPGLVMFPLDLVRRGDILEHIVEWRSPDFHMFRGQGFILWIALFVVVAAKGRWPVSRRDLVVAIPFIGLGLWALRNVGIAPLVGMPVIARAVAPAASRVDAEADDQRSFALGWGFAIVLMAIGLALGVRAAGEPDFVLNGYPVKAMDAVERQGLLGTRLLADDADSGYIILRSWPEQQVFIDDRYDMYPRRVIFDFFELANGGPRWEKILERYDIEVVVWGRGEPLTQYLEQQGGWERVHRDKGWVVLVRDDVPVRA